MLVVGGKTVFNTLEELVSPQHTALLLIDLQHDYITPQDSHGNARKTNTACLQIVPTVKRLLDAARRRGILVVHIQMTHYPGHISDSPAWLRSNLIKAGRKDALSDEQFQTRCIELACEACIENGVAHECVHRLHLVPVWQSAER